MNDLEVGRRDEGSTGLTIPTPSQDEIAWLLVGGGAVGSAVNLARGERGLVPWLLSLGLLGIGCGMLLSSRKARMDSAEASILSELDKLDPIARAQVLSAVAREQIDRLPGVGTSE